jgi:mRNA interferase MazF
MKPGDVLLTTLPQADGLAKDRPVLCLCRVPPFQDVLVCGITTQLSNHVEGLDEIVAVNDEDFQSTGLKAASLIRTAFLALLPQTRFKGRIGRVSQQRHERVIASLVTFLTRPDPLTEPSLS